MGRSFLSPSRYVQGEGELRNIGIYAEQLGGKALIVAAPEDYGRVREDMEAARSTNPYVEVFGEFSGRCTVQEVERLAGIAVEQECNLVIGLGGGRALDTAKAVAHQRGLPVIIVPTIASTDAPCSSIAVLYHESGELARYVTMAQPPHVVLVDTGVIARAPVRFLKAGMGDALSTSFEARSNQRSRLAKAGRSSGVTLAAMAIAEQCYRTLLTDSIEALEACEAGKANEALDNIVEANLLLSGLAFEGCGLAAAHAVHNGFTMLEETRSSLHGEIVAFCVLVQLVLEKAPEDEVAQVLGYLRSMGLPRQLADLGLQATDRERLLLAATSACSSEGPMSNMPFPVTPAEVVEAILEADRLGSVSS